MGMLNRVRDLLMRCSSPAGVLPPTELYNEGWMLRLVLDWFDRMRQPELIHPLSFHAQAVWFSEGLLSSQFLPRHRGDPLAESWTHADGIIGHIVIGNAGRGDITLAQDAAQFTVLEAKMFSKLSPHVTHAQNYDQAARNVACMAQVLAQAGRPPAQLAKLSFYVVAPAEQIKREPSFRKWTNKDSIQKRVVLRASAYIDPQEQAKKQKWLDNWFFPAIECINIDCISWEDVIDFIQRHDGEAGEALGGFYSKCLDYNRTIPDRQNEQLGNSRSLA